MPPTPLPYPPPLPLQQGTGVTYRAQKHIMFVTVSAVLKKYQQICRLLVHAFVIKYKLKLNIYVECSGINQPLQQNDYV